MASKASWICPNLRAVCAGVLRKSRSRYLTRSRNRMRYIMGRNAVRWAERAAGTVLGRQRDEGMGGLPETGPSLAAIRAGNPRAAN